MPSKNLTEVEFKKQKAEYDKKYRQENREQILDYNRDYRNQHSEERAAYAKEYQSKNSDRIRVRLKRWRENNKEHISKSSREYRKNNPDKPRAQHLRRYGLSLTEYAKRLSEQSGVCAICEKKNDSDIRSLAVDHCHITGKIRGLLCTKCNSGLGQFKDSSILLAKAIFYLRGERL